MIETPQRPETVSTHPAQAEGHGPAQPAQVTTPTTPAATPRPQPTYTELELLGEDIAELSLQIDAATYQLLVKIREFDERSGWNSGFRSCAHWMSWRTGTDLGAARERVRVARALADLPLISEALRRGEISYSKVRAISRIATPEIEKELLEMAKSGTASQVEKIVRGLRRVDRLEDLADEERRHQSRFLNACVDEDGTVVVRGRLAPEAGAAFLRALDAAGEKLYDIARHEQAQPPEDTSPEQRRADALGLVAESALAAGLDPGTRGDRYQVVLHVDAAALPAGSETGSSVLADGQKLSAETSRRFSCDSALVVMRHAPDGSVLDVGRRTRTISPALRRALDHRDAGCRFPGCTVKVCDAHHVEHWADGGETKLRNLLMCCAFHHRLLHEGGFTVELLQNGEARFHRPDGRLVEEAPPVPSQWGDAVDSLIARLSAQRITIDVEGSVPDWDGDPVDYGWAVESLLDARDRDGSADELVDRYAFSLCELADPLV